MCGDGVGISPTNVRRQRSIGNWHSVARPRPRNTSCAGRRREPAEEHWLRLLGDRVGKPARTDLATRMLGFLARHFGSVFVLALVQRAESRSTYEADADATPTMAADEHIHEEVVRALAAHGRRSLSGTFRAAVFGANDGLVSNLLVLGVTAAECPTRPSGHRSGRTVRGCAVDGRRRVRLCALAARAARCFRPRPGADQGAPPARRRRQRTGAGLSRSRHGRPSTDTHAAEVLRDYTPGSAGHVIGGRSTDEHTAVGTAVGAALSSFCSFGSGALIPVLPYLFGLQVTVRS